jgi:hypothetical protein
VDENSIPRSIWWGRADWFVFVPWFLVLASFWIYLGGPDRAPWTEAMHEFYGRRHTAEIHTPWVMFGSLLIFLYSFTLFLRRRLLFGRVARSWTIASAILFIGLAVPTGLAALATYGSSFL